MGRTSIPLSKDEILHILDQYVHSRTDRRVLAAYLTDYPDSMERLAEMCDMSLSTVKRIINRNSYIYKYFE